MPVSIVYQFPPTGGGIMDFWQGLTTVLERYGIETLGILVVLYLIVRAVPPMLRAITDILQTRAHSTAKEREAEAAAMSDMIKLVAKQTDLFDRTTTAVEDISSANHQTNRILDEYKNEFRQSRQVSERIEDALKEFNAETKALRLDLKAWPNTVDGTLAGAIAALDALRVSFETANSQAAADHAEVLRLLRETHQQVGVIYRLATRPTPPPPPPTEPDSAAPKAPVTPLDADGAKQATVDLPVMPERKENAA